MSSGGVTGGMQLFEAMHRKKSLAEARHGVGDSVDENNVSGNSSLRRSLTACDLILYGVGSSVGAGIFILVRERKEKAGG